MSLIDLGEIGAPTVHTGRLPARRPARRGWRAGTVLVGVLALLSGSTVVDPLSGTLLLGTVPMGPGGADYGLDGDLLNVARGFPGEPAPVAVYRLGDRLTPRSSLPAGIPLARVSDTLLVATGRCPDSSEGVTGVDPDTGRVRWRRPGRPLTATGRLVLVARPDGAPCAGTGTGRPVTADAVDAATGRVAWTVSTVERVRPRPSGRDLPVLHLADWSGRLVRRDARTGAALGAPVAAPLPPGTGSAATATPLGTELLTLPGALLVLTAAGPDTAVAAVDPVSLRTLWTDRRTGEIGVTACGDLVCLSGPEGTAARSVRDGRVLWRAPWAVRASRSVRWAVGYPALARLGSSRPAVLLDVRTGRTVAGLRGWRIAWPLTLPWSDTGDVAAPEDLLLYRQEDEGTVLGRLEPVDGGFAVWPRARVPAVLSGCSAAGRHLACRAPSPAGPQGVIEVRRLPPGA